jgi:hypothetical protein
MRRPSNIHPSGFDQIKPKTLATATVEWLLHHADLVLTKGDSHRLAKALSGKGWSPSPDLHREQCWPPTRISDAMSPEIQWLPARKS